MTTNNRTPTRHFLIYASNQLKRPSVTDFEDALDGTLTQRVKGTPQGGPISPLIANVFLHYGFDMWMVREYPTVWFERFADDVVVHCVTERQARMVQDAIGRRLAEVGLLMHPDKTRIVYCKDSRRRQDFEQVAFTFCGYMFRPREAFDKVRRREEGLHGFSAGGGPGEADRYEPQGSVLAVASTHQLDTG